MLVHLVLTLALVRQIETVGIGNVTGFRDTVAIVIDVIPLTLTLSDRLVLVLAPLLGGTNVVPLLPLLADVNSRPYLRLGRSL